MRARCGGLGGAANYNLSVRLSRSFGIHIPNFQGLLRFEFDGFNEDELLILFLLN